jgi:hypothetical protein
MNTSHGLKAFHINIFVIIHAKKKTNVKNLYHVTFKLFFENATIF